MFALLFLFIPLTPYNGYYLDTLDHRVPVEILYSDAYDIQHLVWTRDSTGRKWTYAPGRIKGFTVYIDNDTIIYRTVELRGRKVFMQIDADGKYIARYKYTTRRQEDSLIYYKDGRPFGFRFAKPLAHRRSRESCVRMFSDYPLMRTMADKKAFDIDAFEGRIVLDAYNRWRDGPPGDTPMALKGILDANRYYRPQVMFAVGLALTTVLTPAFSGIPLGVFEKIPLKMRLPDPALAANREYLAAYQARAHTRKEQSLVRGYLWGIPGCALFITLVTLL